MIVPGVVFSCDTLSNVQSLWFKSAWQHVEKFIIYAHQKIASLHVTDSADSAFHHENLLGM